MGREEVIQKFNQDKYADGAAYMVRALRETGERFDRLAANLNKILTVKATYTDLDGAEYKVQGRFTMSKAERAELGENAPEAGTIGLKDLFDNPKFLKKPFWEAGRNPDAHFRVYCLANGISEEDLLTLAEENPPRDVLQRVSAMREPFVNMIIKHDTKAMADMYSKFVDYTMTKANDMLSIVDNAQGILNNRDNMILLANVQSYITQTLDLGGNPETQETINLVKEIDNNLKAKGYAFNFHQFENFLAPFATMFQSGCKDSAMTDEEIEEGREGMFHLLVDDDDTAYRGIAQSVFTVGAIANKGYRDYKESSKKLGSVDKAIAAKPFDPLDYRRYNVQDKQASVRAFVDQVSPNQYEIIGTQRVAKDPEELRDQMQSHVRTTLGIARKNSDQYQAVVDTLTAITDLKKELDSAGLTAEMRASNEDQLNKQYRLLKTYSENYLTLRDPSSTDGKERYRMVLEAEQIAKVALDPKLAAERKAEEQKKEDSGKLKRSNSLDVKKVDMKSILHEQEKEEEPKKRSKFSRMMQEVEKKNEEAEFKQKLTRSNTMGKK